MVLLVSFLSGFIGIFLGFFFWGRFVDQATTQSFFTATSEFGNYGTWLASITGFVTLILLIYQNSKLSKRQDELDIKEQTSEANKNINQYNGLIFVLSQHYVDKSNEFRTIYRLLEEAYETKNKDIVFSSWLKMFKEQRHVSNNHLFMAMISQELSKLDAQDLHQLFHYLCLSRQDVTNKLEISLELGVFSQKIISSPEFKLNSKEYDQAIINECIGNFCRELHSSNTRRLINDYIESLDEIKSEFEKLFSIYNVSSQNSLQQKETIKAMRSLVSTKLVVILGKYFVLLELLAKEVTLLEECLIRIENSFGKYLGKRYAHLSGHDTVLIKNLKKGDLMLKLSSLEVILFELFLKK
ncbi:hypothetical protein Vca1114GL_00060 [Vibrio campbellii]|uniref:hypothetical protein n=1 Tax=Vibrio campbellii TaxID=680 RepID=UPI00097FBB6D|nr:hypothetical protein [Vibrio campbellii]AQM66583.1 hypothetical protein Vca1114GL_00060 [Vibrio campbellii]